DPVCRLADIWNGIGNSQGQAGPAHDRQIGQVVPHESGLFGADAEFGQQCLEVNQLISAVEINMLDTERVQPRGDRRGRPAADDCRGYDRALQTLQAETILDAHGFDLVVMGNQVQLAVSQHTVDIKDYDPNPRRLLLDSIGSHVHITFALSRSCMFSAPTVRLSGSTITRPPPPMRFSSSRRIASAAIMSVLAVTGFCVMCDAIPAGLILISSSRSRRRSPSVKTPARRPSGSTTPVMPRPFVVISSRAARSEASSVTTGISAPVCM